MKTKTILIAGFLVLCYGCTTTLRNLKSDCPIVSYIGWPNHQDSITITDLEIEILDSTTNLFNNKIPVRFWISGYIRSDTNWFYDIKQVQIIERFEKKEEDNNKLIVEILIEPYLTSYYDKKGKKEYDFRIKEEYYLHTYKWGQNNYRVRCGAMEKILKLQQNK